MELVVSTGERGPALAFNLTGREVDLSIYRCEALAYLKTEVPIIKGNLVMCHAGHVRGVRRLWVTNL